jgi:polysaccharide biosynthesis protein PslJ
MSDHQSGEIAHPIALQGGLIPPVEDRRRIRIPRGWPLYVITLGYPVWWVLGLSSLIWVILAIPMAFSLVLRRDIRVPRGFGLWVLFLVWMFASGAKVPGGTSWLVFGFRAWVYLSATVYFLYILNSTSDDLPGRRVVFLLAALWTVVLIGGYLGLAFPDVSFRSVAEAVLPGGLTSVDYVSLLIHPRFAEVQNFIGFTIARPAAPFPYTNWWGGNLAALTPFVVLAAIFARSRGSRVLWYSLLTASIVPIVLSVNRGLWLSLGLGLLYAMVRLWLRGNVAAGLAVLLGMLVSILLVLGAPLLKHTVASRFEHPASAQGRSSVIAATIERVEEKSPLFGFGVPGQKEKRLANLTVGGTSGVIWLVLYTTGIPGALLFLAWVMLLLTRSSRPRTTIGFWGHVSVLIVVVQMFYYEMLPVEFHVLMIVAALVWRQEHEGVDEETPRRRERMRAAPFPLSQNVILSAPRLGTRP